MEEISAFAAYTAGSNKNTPKKPKRPKKVKANPKKEELIAEALLSAELTTNAGTLPKKKGKGPKIQTAKPKPTPKQKKMPAKKVKRLQEPAPEIVITQSKKGRKKKDTVLNGQEIVNEVPSTETPDSVKSEQPKKQKTKAVNGQGTVAKTPLKGTTANSLTPGQKKSGKPKKQIEKVVNEQEIITKTPKTLTPGRIKPEKVTPIPNNKRASILPPITDSIQEGLNIFKYLLSPIKVSAFFDEFWEKEPCLVQRNDQNYFSNLISFQAINKMLLDNHVEFTKHIDVTSYTNGIRETLNPEGRALPGTVWDFFESGCSIRLLNPQIFIPAIFTMNTTLQEYFHCMVGANVYLTPPSSQGFAPHYDDIEAFVLQIEGQKRWKLYNPRFTKETLPRTSSGNFSQDEIGEPILDKVLKPGDILYFPRGTIHQAKTEGNKHSLHITLSVYQKQSYADLFEIMFPMMLSKATELNLDVRRGLPMNIWYNCGLVHSDKRSRDREQIITNCRNMLHQVVAMMPLDDAVDQMAKKYLHDALPPDLTPQEKIRTIHAARYYLNSDGQVDCNLDPKETTKVRLLRANILRLVEEGEKFHIYFYADNSREYHEYEPNFLEINPEDAPSIEFLISCYPEYVAIKDLPLESDEQKFSVVQGLFDRGLLMLENPLD